jgi:7-carboxy-7-deazaguanine synthase
MPKTIISSYPEDDSRLPKDDGVILEVSELFTDTVQGEGINIGHPATFLRLQNCTLDCVWCDTSEVWRYGNPYSVNELLNLLLEHDVVTKLRYGQHLVLTGGSPLNQQTALVSFITEFERRFSFIPIIEIENECTRMPLNRLVPFISYWNNSPKLSSSGNSLTARYRPNILRYLSTLTNSWFKFVITSEQDWFEIETNFLRPELISVNQIILMPQGQTKAELELSRLKTVELAIKYGVRFTDRLHIALWDKKTGI